MCLLEPPRNRERGISFDVLDEMAAEVEGMDIKNTFIHFQSRLSVAARRESRGVTLPARRDLDAWSDEDFGARRPTLRRLDSDDLPSDLGAISRIRTPSPPPMRPAREFHSPPFSPQVFAPPFSPPYSPPYSPVSPLSPDGMVQVQKKRSRRSKAVPPPQAHEITLMLRHLPLRFTPDGLLSEFCRFVPHIDFYYLPTNFETRLNLGYAFLNFVDRSAAEEFTAFWERSGIPESDDVPVQPARVQGFAANVDRFRSSSVMAVLPEALQPRVFRDGVPQCFPAPLKQIPCLGPRFRPTGDDTTTVSTRCGSDEGRRSRSSSENL